MVAFLTTWPLIDGLIRSWQDLSCLSELLNDAGEDVSIIDPDLARVRPNSNDLLSRRMSVLGLNAAEVARIEPGIFLDLRRTCVVCDSRAQCDTDLKRESSEDDTSDAQTWQDYCPNVATLNMLSSLLPAMQGTAHSSMRFGCLRRKFPPLGCPGNEFRTPQGRLTT